MENLFVIPARGGSKTIPNKNIKELRGRPLIEYSIQFARKFAPDRDICISTDDKNIAAVVKKFGMDVPFIRPPQLSADETPAAEVLLHTIGFYENTGRSFKYLVLLQPTSPFRKESHFKAMLNLMDDDSDMVVSVMQSKANPYFNLFEENENGFLLKSKVAQDIYRRQDAPVVYQFNGSIYIINILSLKKYKSLSRFRKIKKYVMEPLYSIDIDDSLDWLYCEFLSERVFNQSTAH